MGWRAYGPIANNPSARACQRVRATGVRHPRSPTGPITAGSPADSASGSLRGRRPAASMKLGRHVAVRTSSRARSQNRDGPGRPRRPRTGLGSRSVCERLSSPWRAPPTSQLRRPRRCWKRWLGSDLAPAARTQQEQVIATPPPLARFSFPPGSFLYELFGTLPPRGIGRRVRDLPALACRRRRESRRGLEPPDDGLNGQILVVHTRGTAAGAAAVVGEVVASIRLRLHRVSGSQPSSDSGRPVRVRPRGVGNLALT